MNEYFALIKDGTVINYIVKDSESTWVPSEIGVIAYKDVKGGIKIGDLFDGKNFSRPIKKEIVVEGPITKLKEFLINNPDVLELLK